jgi:hypothetical protein
MENFIVETRCFVGWGYMTGGLNLWNGTFDQAGAEDWSFNSNIYL